MSRSYIETTGRVHKAALLWHAFKEKTISAEKFLKDTQKLLAQYVRDGKTSQPILPSINGKEFPIFPISFKGKGYHVMDLCRCLSDLIPDIMDYYDQFSTYIHGDFSHQLIKGKAGYYSALDGENNIVIHGNNAIIDRVRAVVLKDFQVLLAVTKGLRDRYDLAHPDH